MRVISGSAKGTKLLSPKGLSTRPTADRIKESVFNIISPILIGVYFLDLYAGSGSIGIEALSRGARKCVFVENGKEAFSALTKNLEKTKLASYAGTCFEDVEIAVKKLSAKRERFDIIYMDPPYATAEEMDKLTKIIANAEILCPDGVIIGEHSAALDINSFENIELLKRRSYGKTTAVSFWRPLKAEQTNDKGNFSGNF